MTTAIVSQGFDFKIRTAVGPDVFTSVLGITNFTGFDGEASEIDTTDLKSVAKEFIMGLPDSGKFSLTTNYLPHDTGQLAMRAAKADATSPVQKLKMILSDGTTATFDGYITSAPISGGVDAKVEGSFGIRITGAVVIT